MRITSRFLLLFVVFAFFVSSARGQAAPPLPIAEYLDETTLGVAEIDLSSADIDATFGWLQAIAKQAGLPAKELDAMAAELQKANAPVKSWLTQFAKGGGKKLYVVAMMNDAAPFYAIIPTAGGDPAAMKALLGGGPEGLPKNMTNGTNMEVVGGHTLWGFPAALTAAKETKANAQRQPRPDIAAAFAAAGQGHIRVAFAPPQQVKGLIIIDQPNLPPQLGGGTTAPVVNAFVHATASLTLPTAASPRAAAASVHIRAKDAAGVQKLKTVLDAVVATGKKEAGDNPDLAKLIDMITPQVAGDSLALDLDQPRLEAFAKQALPAFLAARAQATRMQGMSNLRQLAIAVILFAEANQGALPAQLPDALGPFVGGPEVLKQLLVNPVQPNRPTGYIFPKPGTATKLSQVRRPDVTIFAYESFDQFPAGGVNVAFYDGHCELFSTEASFKKALADSAAALANP